MKILKLEDFLYEKKSISPLTIKDFKEMEKNNKEETVYQESDTETSLEDIFVDDPHVCSTPPDIVQKLRKYNIDLDYNKMSNACDDTYKRIMSWKMLIDADFLKKNRERSDRNMTTEKIFSCIIALLRYYRAVSPKRPMDVYVKCLEYYINRIKRDFNLTQEEILKLYKNKSL